MKEQLDQIARIFNTLSTISTKGEDTLVMADCLRAIQQVYSTLSDMLTELEKKDKSQGE